MSFTFQTVLDQNGKPSAALIPWEQFVELMESNGLDLDDEMRSELREALQDSEKGIRSSFVREDEI